MKEKCVDFRKLERTLVIAEIGVNHEGDISVAKDLINKAAKAGADIVKFQTFHVDHYVSREQPERYERAKGFQLSYDQFRELAKEAEAADVEFLSTPLHMTDIDFLDEIANMFKISSGDLTYLPLLHHAASKRKPMIISTGLGDKNEISDALNTVRQEWPEGIDEGKVLLMHCVSSYPTPPEDANLRNLNWLRDEFGVPVGYSDHTLGIKACELAVAMGAKVIEKHFTYRKENQSFHDHLLSADPSDLEELIKVVRSAEVYLGATQRIRSISEKKMLQHMRRSIGTIVDIPAGETIKEEWLTYLRPQWGLLPRDIDKVVGKQLNRDITAGELIRKEDLA